MKRSHLGYWFISPWLLGFIVLTFLPFLASIYLSFCRYDVLSAPVWIGLGNYEELFSNDPLFWQSLKNTLLYAVLAVPLGIVAAFALALLLNVEVWGVSVYRTIHGFEGLNVGLHASLADVAGSGSAQALVVVAHFSIGPNGARRPRILLQARTRAGGVPRHRAASA